MAAAQLNNPLGVDKTWRTSNNSFVSKRENAVEWPQSLMTWTEVFIGWKPQDAGLPRDAAAPSHQQALILSQRSIEPAQT
jgi:hypothetical protein